MKLNAALASFAKSARKDYILGLHLPKGERLFHFCKESRMVPLIEDEPGREMCAELESTIPRWGTDEQQRKLYLAPRNTFKTTIVQAFVVYLLLLYPNVRILIVRATHNDAIGILRSIMQTLSSNDVIVEAWGDFSKTALIWTETAITIGTRDNREMALKEPSVDTAGIGVSKTGYHPDVVLIDDPVHENNYRSAKAREDGRLTIDALSPVLETHGSMVVTGTFWSENDLYSWIIEQDNERVQRAERVGQSGPKARKWQYYIRSAYDLGNGEAGFDQFGNPRELFFPGRLTWKYLNSQKSLVDIKLFTAWFENRTTVEETRHFKPEYFQFFEADYYPYPTPTLEFQTGLIIPLRVAMQIDPAPTAHLDTSDAMGVVVQGWDARDKNGDYRWWFLDAREIRKTPSESTFDIVDMLKEYVPEVLVIEAALADPEFVSRVALAIRELGLPTIIKSYSALRDERRKTNDLYTEGRSRSSKELRIKAMEPIFRQRLALLRRGRCAVLRSQLLKWPNVDHDDVADAASMGRLVAGPCAMGTMVEVQDQLEAEEERLSWGPEGRPARVSKVATNGSHYGFGAAH